MNFIIEFLYVLLQVYLFYALDIRLNLLHGVRFSPMVLSGTLGTLLMGKVMKGMDMYLLLRRMAPYMHMEAIRAMDIILNR